MSEGLAVLATDIGNNDIIKNNKTGLLFKLDDIHDAVSALKVTSPDLRTCLGRNAREEVKELYSSEIMVKRTIQAYQQA